MSSNCDSGGYPIDHDGNRLEDDGCFSSVAPFAVRSDVLHEILSGSGKEVKGNHLDADLLEGSWVKASALGGGIPVADTVVVEDYISSEEEALSPRAARDACKSSTSATIQAVLRTSKHERDELYRARKKLMDVLKFLRFKGFTEEEIYKELYGSGGAEIPKRDDFGLPNLDDKVEKGNPFVEKLKNKAEPEGTHVVLDEMPNLASQEGKKEQTTSTQPPKSWSQVVTESSPTAVKAKFTFIPPDAGVSGVSPPDEVLKKGNEKLKTTIVGTFTKGVVPYLKLVDFANKVWKGRGLVHVGQRDNKTFLFRFRSEEDMNFALAKGTWYIERKPMVVHAWGTNVHSITSMPLWVRFDKLPDSYWTEECLSRLASCIGPPLCADELTSKLEILPFAKICVNYTIGDPLPSSIPVTTLDPSTGAKHSEDVLVSYPNRPLVCTSCKSLGHLVGACPITIRKWVRKEPKPPVVSGPQVIPPQDPSATTHTTQTPPKPVTAGVSAAENYSTKRPPSPSSPEDLDRSATPTVGFKNLKKVDEIDMKRGSTSMGDKDGFQLSKSQKKRLKKQGKLPSSSP